VVVVLEVIQGLCMHLRIRRVFLRRLAELIRPKTLIISVARISRNAKIVRLLPGRNLEMLVTAGLKNHILYGKLANMGQFLALIE
jgi:2-polyprenyl-3-methyl-5-hydroxy-6-metoxy-1,4-benzoquinol methylase